jgi:beta-glucosidase
LRDPTLELKGIAKVALRPGETGTARFELPATELAFLGVDFEPVLEPGEIEIHVGASADPAQLTSSRVMLRP